MYLSSLQQHLTHPLNCPPVGYYPYKEYYKNLERLLHPPPPKKLCKTLLKHEYEEIIPEIYVVNLFEKFQKLTKS